MDNIVVALDIVVALELAASATDNPVFRDLMSKAAEEIKELRKKCEDRALSDA
jgi:hypothetical protein